MKVIKISIVIETCTRDNIPNVQIIQMVKIDIINKQKLKERNNMGTLDLNDLYAEDINADNNL